MPIDFRCDKCAARYSVDEELAGTSQICKQCKVEMTIPFPPLELPEEVTEGGSTVYRHEAGDREFQPAFGEEQNIAAISAHIEKHIGPVENVLHEIISDLVHIDVHCIEPTEDRPFRTLVTSGMSDLPMNTPEGLEELQYAELCICLPPDWPISKEAFADHSNYWPVEWLKILARFPHEYETWLFEGHTIPNGDPPEPFAPNTKFCGWLLFCPVLAPEEFFELKLENGKTIHFFTIYPLYEGEMNMKLKKGTEALVEKFEKAGVTDVLDLDRKDVSKRTGFWPFG